MQRKRMIIPTFALLASAMLLLMQVPSLNYFGPMFYLLAGVFLVLAAYYAWRLREN